MIGHWHNFNWLTSLCRDIATNTCGWNSRVPGFSICFLKQSFILNFWRNHAWSFFYCNTFGNSSTKPTFSWFPKIVTWGSIYNELLLQHWKLGFAQQVWSKCKNASLSRYPRTLHLERQQVAASKKKYEVINNWTYVFCSPPQSKKKLFENFIAFNKTSLLISGFTNIWEHNPSFVQSCMFSLTTSGKWWRMGFMFTRSHHYDYLNKPTTSTFCNYIGLLQSLWPRHTLGSSPRWACSWFYL